MIRICEACGQKNRVPAAKPASQQGRCGACRPEIPESQPGYEDGDPQIVFEVRAPISSRSESSAGPRVRVGIVSGDRDFLLLILAAKDGGAR